EGVPVIESYALGRAFGRVDLDVDPVSRRVVAARVDPPEELRAHATYEGARVTPDPAVAAAIASYVDGAAARKAQPLGVRLEDAMKRDYGAESAEGNLFAD